MRLRVLVLAAIARACALGAEESAPAGMARIPVGAFDPPTTLASEEPSILVPAFYLDIRPVTNGEFLAFVRANPQWQRSRTSPLFAESGYLGDWEGDLDPGPGAPADAPVVRVSWFAARAYAEWRGKRLPNTAEWERAARAGFTSENGPSEAAYRQLSMDWLAAPTVGPLKPAGSGRPNIFGVRDLVSLVWEWVDDFNGASLGSGAVCGAGAEAVRDFSDYPAFMREAFRSSLRANFVVANLGFRCAASESTAALSRGPNPGQEGPILTGLSERSLYVQGGTWTSDAGTSLRLADLQGHPVVLALIYTGCASACPATVQQMKALEASLPEPARRETRFVLVSFDTASDTPAVLRRYREAYGLQRSKWVLLHGTPDQVRVLAMMLGVAYREVGPGVFVHSTGVSILNAGGEITTQLPSLSDATQVAAQAVARSCLPGS